ncbi:hypothetical protein B0F90DRAFT_1717291 [Multifurca ochricompacta]|uniref:BTB domain-containing protein n=1 Tax=Multifurca ochricompacta TaxID=376703 RepID=A0AAD4QP08_9AGAM|nr:hypothetical protein B0F90DRAFT_1717291 [Multifurca ochricompacta]
MSTAPPNNWLFDTPTVVPCGDSSTSDAETLFDFYPDADIILRSSDHHEFRVPRIYIINSSPPLRKLLVQAISNLDTPSIEREASLATVQLPERSSILSRLLTFIFPVPATLPSTIEEIMELLSVAQKYEIYPVLTQIRDRIARQHPKFISPETALRVYSLAQKYKLREEDSMTIEDLEDKLDVMPGAFLYELWKFHQRARGNLLLDILGFRMTDLRQTLKDLQCSQLGCFGFPRWLDNYVDSITKTPAVFDITEFHMALTRHVVPSSTSLNGCSHCGSISSETMHEFWIALETVVQGSFGKAELFLSLVTGEPRSQSHPTSMDQPPPPRPNLNLREADVVLQSSDNANFPVHKSVLATSSPFFSDLFSFAQPSDDEVVDGLHVIRLTEDAEVLHCLITMLYPIPSVIPDSYDRVLDLLAVTQKYDMAAVQSSLRVEISQKTFPALTSTPAAPFHAYAIASSKGLTPEMEHAARLTLDYPMTFESIGDELKLFDGWALRDLAHFRKRCRDSIVLFLKSLLDCHEEPSKIWVGCLNTPRNRSRDQGLLLAGWLHDLILRNIRELQRGFTCALPNEEGLRKQYMTALQAHIRETGCSFCSRVHVMEGDWYWERTENGLSLAKQQVCFNSNVSGVAGNL